MSVVFFIVGLFLALCGLVGKFPLPKTFKEWTNTKLDTPGRTGLSLLGMILVALSIYALSFAIDNIARPTACDLGFQITTPAGNKDVTIQDDELVGGVGGVYEKGLPSGWEVWIFSTYGRNGYRPKSLVKFNTSDNTWRTVSPLWIGSKPDEELIAFLVGPVGKALIHYHYDIAAQMEDVYEVDPIWFPIEIKNFEGEFLECDAVNLAE